MPRNEVRTVDDTARARKMRSEDEAESRILEGAENPVDIDMVSDQLLGGVDLASVCRLNAQGHVVNR